MLTETYCLFLQWKTYSATIQILYNFIHIFGIKVRKQFLLKILFYFRERFIKISVV